MKRVLCFLIVVIMSVAASAQRGVDFASKFMQNCKGDTAVHCVTISPKMIEQMTKQGDACRNEHILQSIQKLKSAQIITTSVHGEGYFQMAENLLKKNAQRFHHSKDYKTERAYGTFYTRDNKNGNTVELIMLHVDSHSKRLIIVNLTGDIDEEFINGLTKNFSGRTADRQGSKWSRSLRG